MMRVMAEEERRLQSLYYPPQDCNQVLGMDHHALPFHVSVGQVCQVHPSPASSPSLPSADRLGWRWWCVPVR